MRLMEKGMRLIVDRDIDRLAKLYVEPTNRCNLDCRTCMRQGWEEGLGFMEFELFRKDHGGPASFARAARIFFWRFRRAVGPSAHRGHGGPGQGGREAKWS